MPNKAVAAGGYAAIAGALTTIVISALGHPVSPDVQSAISTLISAACAFGGAWVTKMEGGA